jgi:hypothetical protein
MDARDTSLLRDLGDPAKKMWNAKFHASLVSSWWKLPRFV